MPRAKMEDLQGYSTTSKVADLLGLSAYLIKARIEDGSLPTASRTSDSGVLLFDDAWIAEAQVRLSERTLRKRRREPRSTIQSIPSPEQVLGHRPGEEGWIPSWGDVVRYFDELDRQSSRVSVMRLGTSTQGRPYIAVAISASENMDPADRERNTRMLTTLWEGGDIAAEELDHIYENGKTVGIILATQHSTEIGGTLMTLELAHALASATDPATLDVLANTITVLIPSHNPDGIDMIAEWNARYVGTEFIGADLPFLYHPYTGHDNNRDWFMFTQVETRLFVDLHNAEHPQAVFDMHQMGRNGVRYMVPPFIDPLDPNQDPVIQQGFAALGSHIAQRMTAAGKTGVATHAMFDNYSPSLSYGNYHGSVDLLSEAASANLASTVRISEKDLTGERGIDPKIRSWNHPLPWEEGDWSIDDIVSYNLVAARAFIEHLSSNRRQWLRDYRDLNQRVATRVEKPYGFVIPRDQRDPEAAAELLELLQRGCVTVHEATAEVTLDGVRWPAGTRVVNLSQSAGAFAKTLLEIQEYPDIRQYEGGPALPPYDVVGHTLPIQMGVKVVELTQPIGADAALKPVTEAIQYEGQISGDQKRATAWVFDHQSLGCTAALSDLKTERAAVYRVREVTEDLPIGAIVVPAAGHNADVLKDVAAGTGTDLRAVQITGHIAAYRVLPVRVGVFQPYTASMDEGWARWVLEDFGIEYTTLTVPDVLQGGLIDRFDVVLLPHISPDHLRHGQAEKSREGDPNVPEFQRGLGDHGFDELRRFTERGGTLIAIDAATTAVIEEFSLPVRTPLAELSKDEFSCPGSLVRVVMDTRHPLAYGMPRESAVLFMNSVAFSETGHGATTVGSFPMLRPKVSGWIAGEKHLAGRSALVDVEYGKGHVVLVGFRPYFRAQTRATYKVLFNAIARAGYREETLSL